MKNIRGQILLPGLGIFLGLMMLFLALVVFGRHVLMQMRVTMVAEATALSVARAQAVMMNKFASYNDAINLMLAGKYKSYAILQRSLRGTLEAAATYQRWYQLPQFYIFPRQVGRWVAKANGCDPGPKFIPTRPMLEMPDMEVQLMEKQWPASLGPVEIDNVYYARSWGPGKRKVQPPHQTHWMVTKDGVKGFASARLYLDVQADESMQNGGFPSSDPEHWWDDVQIQSFYPQFNACLLPAARFKTLLEHS